MLYMYTLPPKHRLVLLALYLTVLFEGLFGGYCCASRGWEWWVSAHLLMVWYLEGRDGARLVCGLGRVCLYQN